MYIYIHIYVYTYIYIHNYIRSHFGSPIMAAEVDWDDVGANDGLDADGGDEIVPVVAVAVPPRACDVLAIRPAPAARQPRKSRWTYVIPTPKARSIPDGMLAASRMRDHRASQLAHFKQHQTKEVVEAALVKLRALGLLR